jgi:hypothetical protein
MPNGWLLKAPRSNYTSIQVALMASIVRHQTPTLSNAPELTESACSYHFELLSTSGRNVITSFGFAVHNRRTAVGVRYLGSAASHVVGLLKPSGDLPPVD